MAAHLISKTQILMFNISIIKLFHVISKFRELKKILNSNILCRENMIVVHACTLDIRHIPNAEDHLYIYFTYFLRS